MTRKLILCQQRHPEHLEPIKSQIIHHTYQTISLFFHNNLCIKSAMLRFRINKEIKHKSMLFGGYQNLSLLHRARLLITELLLNTWSLDKKLQRVILARHLCAHSYSMWECRTRNTHFKDISYCHYLLNSRHLHIRNGKFYFCVVKRLKSPLT